MTLKLEIELGIEDRRRTSSSSKGNQIKWYKDGYWYKANQFGYEGESEILASKVLGCSSINNFVVYEPCIVVEKREFSACRCASFLGVNDVFMSMYRFFRGNGIDLDTNSEYLSLSPYVKMLYVSNLVSNMTRIEGFLEYVKYHLVLDALILNEDRHMNNMGFIYNIASKTYRLAPIFDNAYSLLSDESEYGGKPIEMLVEDTRAKPFSKSFTEQYNNAKSCNFRICRHTFDTMVSMQEKTRAVEVLLYQARKYPELFVEN